MSCFLRDGDRVFHTYSTYARGTESIGGSYYFLDMTALGRQEEWRSPRIGAPGWLPIRAALPGRCRWARSNRRLLAGWRYHLGFSATC